MIIFKGILYTGIFLITLDDVLFCVVLFFQAPTGAMKVEVESGSNANLISVSVPDYVADQSTKVIELNSLLVRIKYHSCFDNINNIVKGVNK